MRDYTYYVKAKVGFSNEVDTILKRAAEVSPSKELAQYVVFVIDEMHIREDLVYDKQRRVSRVQKPWQGQSAAGGI